MVPATTAPVMGARRDPLDVPAERLRERIRLAMSLINHRRNRDDGLDYADLELVEHVLFGEEWL